MKFCRPSRKAVLIEDHAESIGDLKYAIDGIPDFDKTEQQSLEQQLTEHKNRIMSIRQKTSKKKNQIRCNQVLAELQACQTILEQKSKYEHQQAYNPDFAAAASGPDSRGVLAVVEIALENLTVEVLGFNGTISDPKYKQLLASLDEQLTKLLAIDGITFEPNKNELITKVNYVTQELQRRTEENERKNEKFWNLNQVDQQIQGIVEEINGIWTNCDANTINRLEIRTEEIWEVLTGIEEKQGENEVKMFKATLTNRLQQVGKMLVDIKAVQGRESSQAIKEISIQKSVDDFVTELPVEETKKIPAPVPKISNDSFSDHYKELEEDKSVEEKKILPPVVKTYAAEDNSNLNASDVKTSSSEDEEIVQNVQKTSVEVAEELEERKVFPPVVKIVVTGCDNEELEGNSDSDQVSVGKEKRNKVDERNEEEPRNEDAIYVDDDLNEVKRDSKSIHAPVVKNVAVLA